MVGPVRALGATDEVASFVSGTGGQEDVLVSPVLTNIGREGGAGTVGKGGGGLLA